MVHQTGVIQLEPLFFFFFVPLSGCYTPRTYDDSKKNSSVLSNKFQLSNSKWRRRKKEKFSQFLFSFSVPQPQVYHHHHFFLNSFSFFVWITLPIRRIGEDSSCCLVVGTWNSFVTRTGRWRRCNSTRESCWFLSVLYNNDDDDDKRLRGGKKSTFSLYCHFNHMKIL